MQKQERKNIPKRFTWALEKVDASENESILEIGCGTGILAALIAGGLNKGRVTVLDKSKPMMIKAAHHLEQNIIAGRAEVVTNEFALYNAREKFDKVVAFNVNFFWKESPEEFEVLKSTLQKDSVLFVFYDTPGKMKSTISDRIKENLSKNNFQVREVLFMNKDRSVCCIKAVLSQGV